MRRRDWKARLSAYVTEAARAPYRPGTHDCALFAAGAVEAVTGTDPALGWRGRYSSRAGGLRLLLEAGIGSYVDATAAALPEIHPCLAAAGDIAVLEDPATGNDVLGVVQGEMIYVLQLDGLGLMPRGAMKRAFRT